MIKKQWLQLRYVLGLGVLFIVLVRICIFIVFVFHSLFDIPYDSISAGITGIIIQTVAYTVVIGVGLKDQHKTLASVCLFKKVNGKVWFASIILSIGLTFFYFYFIALFYSFSYEWDTRFTRTGGNFYLKLIETAIIPAVAEELLFKGLVFTILKKYYTTITAVIITSFMFAVLHLSTIRFIPLFLCSCFSFWIYLRSGSLLLPIADHFINNLFSFVLINEPFAYIGTFYAALALLITGSYFLYKYSKAEQKAVNHKSPGRC